MAEVEDRGEEEGAVEEGLVGSCCGESGSRNNVGGGGAEGFFGLSIDRHLLGEGVIITNSRELAV